MGPVEIVVLEFDEVPGDGSLVAPMRDLVDAGVVRLVDVVLARRADDGTLSCVELDGAAADAFAELVHQLDGLIAEEDVEQLCTDLEPGRTALLIAFENAWLMPVLAAARAAGGSVLTEVAVPDEVVAAVIEAAGEG